MLPSSPYMIKIRSESRVDDTSLWRNGCSRRRGGGRMEETDRRWERCRDGKKEVECGGEGRRGKPRREERDLVRREKADTADVAGERNAAGISGRKLRGRVRRRGSGTKRGSAHGGGRGVKGGFGGLGRGDRGREVLPAFKTSRRGHGSSLASRNCGTLRRRRKR